jgi:quercetin dioxygenase-like cupin family protein
MGLFAPAAEVPIHTVDMQGSVFETRFVYGTQGSLMVATRPPGYHSRPHSHPCEQLNYLQDGALWIFVERRAYRLGPGDFLRIPPVVVHWSWNKSDSTCTLIEMHCPGLQDDPMMQSAAVPLFEDGEPATVTGSPRNEFIDYDPKPAERLSEFDKG